MLIASATNNIKFHSWPSGELVSSYKSANVKKDGPIKSISWSRDGTWVVLVPTKGYTEIITLKGSTKFLHLINSIQLPSCATFQNTTKKSIALGTSNGQVLLYDMKSKSVKKRLPPVANSSGITNVIWNAKDTHVIASCQNGDILLYNITSCNLSNTFHIPNSRTVNCITSQSINYIAGGSEEGIVASWDINVNKIVSCVQTHAGPVEDLLFSPMSPVLLVSVGMDRYCSFYDIRERKLVLKLPTEKTPTALDFCPDKSSLAIGCNNGFVYHYDLRNCNNKMADFITKPVSCFQAHETAFRNMFFQKKSAEDSSVVCRPDVVSSAVSEKPSSNASSVYNSFANLMSGFSSVDHMFEINNRKHEQILNKVGLSNSTLVPITSKEDNKTTDVQDGNGNLPKQFTREEDSFLCNLDMSSRSVLQEVSDKIQKETSNKIAANQTSLKVPIIKQLTQCDTPTVDEKIKFPKTATAATSTPVLNIEENVGACPNVSPIVKQNVVMEDKSVQTDEIVTEGTSTTRNDDLLFKKIQDELANLKTELRYEMMDQTRALQQQLFSFRWFTANEFLILQEKYENSQSNSLED